MRVLAVASGGGHWTQLLRLRPAFAGCHTTWVSTHPGFSGDVAPDPFFAIRDANRWDRLGLGIQLLQLARIMLKARPDAVVTTGAAPGYFAVRLSKIIGARTLWLDSIANAEELSLSGMKAGPHCDLWLTQWEHLAASDGPHFRGAVL